MVAAAAHLQLNGFNIKVRPVLYYSGIKQGVGQLFTAAAAATSQLREAVSAGCQLSRSYQNIHNSNLFWQ
jgi:hypothetical protein